MKMTNGNSTSEIKDKQTVYFYHRIKLFQYLETYDFTNNFFFNFFSVFHLSTFYYGLR